MCMCEFPKSNQPLSYMRFRIAMRRKRRIGRPPDCEGRVWYAVASYETTVGARLAESMRSNPELRQCKKEGM